MIHGNCTYLGIRSGLGVLNQMTRLSGFKTKILYERLNMILKLIGLIHVVLCFLIQPLDVMQKLFFWE